MTDFIKCPECNELFNPAYLDQVAFHLHDGVTIDETFKGEKIMIKPQDLRKGNLLLFGINEVIHITVETIGSDGINHNTTYEHPDDGGGEFTDFYKFEDLKGIPLTSEILKSLQPWQLRQIDDLMTWDVKGVTINQTYRKIEFVHELQNFYNACTAEELKIGL